MLKARHRKTKIDNVGLVLSIFISTTQRISRPPGRNSWRRCCVRQARQHQLQTSHVAEYTIRPSLQGKRKTCTVRVHSTFIHIHATNGENVSSAYSTRAQHKLKSFRPVFEFSLFFRATAVNVNSPCGNHHYTPIIRLNVILS